MVTMKILELGLQIIFRTFLDYADTKDRNDKQQSLNHNDQLDDLD